ncbi:hypothetical protein K402DRAFT_369337 [Aulographum hederae CBS 113979]|uniref:ClpX, ATPase regulatory subunit n=1 Tax=Aulographum hederae CBS 113979 TaxID=1176131 RepID=A0A6G1HBY3_9PEZI|nr:hypothetical protein K402DRAFT_369337 [Aulographum hederae CBS 113979]
MKRRCSRVAAMASSTITISPQARLSYLALYSIRRNLTTTARRRSSSHFNRSDFGGQPFTGFYEPGQPTAGPLSGASVVGTPRITPRKLKEHLDEYVVGQEAAKKVLGRAVYNHYVRIQELQRQEEEHEEKLAQQARIERAQRHPVEDEFPGQMPTVNLYPSPPPPPQQPLGSAPLQDSTPLMIEKSNVLLLGTSGVGKTLMAKTLAKVLEVPFSMSDCTAFTQAGYIGEDAEVCVQRLLAAANYDVSLAERGIICLDEVDKIATAKVSHGKDVSGEGVQQSLLKIIEGTTLQFQAKQERGAPNSRSSQSNYPSSGGGNGTGGLGGSGGPPSGGSKNETYSIRTDNILFICAGAFNGLHKMILDRVSRNSMGFGASVRSSNPSAGSHETTLSSAEERLFRDHLPYYIPEFDSSLRANNSKHLDQSQGHESPPAQPQPRKKPDLNILDLVSPADLQKYGMIPELVGRIPISCALSALDEEALIRVLTEPRGALVSQYAQIFMLSGIELRFTRGALREVAKAARGMGTGARGLKTVLERVLGESMFECPGSPVKHVLVNQAVAKCKQAPIYMVRGQSAGFNALVADEEAKEEGKSGLGHPRDGEDDGSGSGDADGGVSGSFEEYRQKATVAGSV